MVGDFLAVVSERAWGFAGDGLQSACDPVGHGCSAGAAGARDAVQVDDPSALAIALARKGQAASGGLSNSVAEQLSAMRRG